MFIFLVVGCFHRDNDEHLFLFVATAYMEMTTWYSFPSFVVSIVRKVPLTCLFYLHLLCLCFVDEKVRNEERLRVMFMFFCRCKLARKQGMMRMASMVL